MASDNRADNQTPTTFCSIKNSDRTPNTDRQGYSERSASKQQIRRRLNPIYALDSLFNILFLRFLVNSTIVGNFYDSNHFSTASLATAQPTANQYARQQSGMAVR